MHRKTSFLLRNNVYAKFFLSKFAAAQLHLSRIGYLSTFLSSMPFPCAGVICKKLRVSVILKQKVLLFLHKMVKVNSKGKIPVPVR